MLNIGNAFQRRLAKRHELRGQAASFQIAPSKKGILEIIVQIAQISVAIVAIFGYFFTVRPVYQKELLAEKVAEYDGIIRKQAPKVAAIALQLTELRREREHLTSELQRERTRLASELKNIEGQLTVAREEKSKIENQIQFMTYRYRLPDGSPAVTREQVTLAQEGELKRNFSHSLNLSCGLGIGLGILTSPVYGKADPKNKFFPFSEQEISTWQEHGSKYPLRQALACIESVALQFSRQHGQRYSPELIDGFRKEASQQATQAASKPWVPPTDPSSLIQELATKRSAIQTELATALKKVEDEYGNWESAFGEQRRIILKHNYEVTKKNAETNAWSSQFSAEYEIQSKANNFRKSIGDEVKRLMRNESKGDSK